ncbi:HNHc domain containing protein [uncultured Caudovirales phage]|uniref:HNHc domain containing protein n=1 Tax=uncultured Caudovirales phage TaxID=2100421 RepID=A0A6J5MDA0_9CAUD|nr:HNHc domain containing protein [uncultured Caudovirales phage]
MTDCLNCGATITAKYAKKFCNSSCAATYNNQRKPKRSEESRNRTRVAMIAVGPMSAEARAKAVQTYTDSRLRYLFQTPFEELAYQTKRVRVIIEQGGVCAHCGISEWRGQPVCFEMDHIDGDNTNNARENLEILCPNCHSNTPTWKGRKANRNRDKINEYIALRKQMVESAGAAPARER